MNQSTIACGRTAPKRGQSTRETLRDCVEYLWRRDARVAQYHKLFTERTRTGNDGVHLLYFARPLPPVCLPDGTRPFLINIHLNGRWIGGRRPLDGLRDPLMKPLWRECLDARPTNARLRIRLRPRSLLQSVSLTVQPPEPNGMAVCTARLDYMLGELGPDGLLRVVEALDLARYARPEDLDPTAIAREGHREPGHWCYSTFPLNPLPPDPDLPAQFAEGLDRLGPVDAGPEVELFAAEYEERYAALRTRLNAIAGGWDCDIVAWYRDGFDPFLSPPDPPPGEEYRYPVAAYLSRHALAIQLDVVHGPEGSYLEFLSARGEKQVHHYAELADVELEMWKGPLAERWGDSSGGSRGGPEGHY